ncbi:MAG: Clp protease ClpP [Burkholderiaceae bacterium]|nr:Clp protease ClpP [Burkholderiaceae bacterium]
MTAQKNSWYAIAPRAEDNETEISIFDEIGYYGVSAKQFVDDLKTVPAGHRILLRIHSPGGEVFDGNVIYNALKRHAGGVIVQIEGLAASMASVIALAGVPVKMAANAFFMIHNPWGMAVGDAAEMRDQASLLDKIKSNMIRAYAEKSGKSDVAIEEWMDAETWFTAEEAKAVGFVDEITDALPVAASANKFARLAKFRNAPRNLTGSGMQMDAQTITPEAPAGIEPTEPAAPENSEPALAAPTTPSEPAISEAPAAPEAPAEPEVPAEPAVEAPVAALNREALIARIGDLANALASANARVAELESNLETERTLRKGAEALAGLAPARVVPEIAPSGDQGGADPVREYLAAVEAGDRKLAAQLFEKHKAAIWAHRKTISKE